MRGDSTLMDASSASGCDFFPTESFHPRRALKGEWRSSLGERHFFSFGLIVVWTWPDGMITALTASQRLNVSIRSIPPAMASP